MPAQEGCRGDEEGDPAVARDQAAGRCEEHPVAGLVSGWARGSSEDPELVTQDEDLEILGPIVSATLATGADEPDEDADREGEEGEHPPIVGALIANRGLRPPRAFGFSLAPDQIGAILAVTAVILGLITRSRVRISLKWPRQSARNGHPGSPWNRVAVSGETGCPFAAKQGVQNP